MTKHQQSTKTANDDAYRDVLRKLRPNGWLVVVGGDRFPARMESGRVFFILQLPNQPFRIFAGKLGHGQSFVEDASVFESIFPLKSTHPVMSAMGRMGGLKGGRVRAERMTPEQRSESARKAAEARWRKV